MVDFDKSTAREGASFVRDRRTNRRKSTSSTRRRPATGPRKRQRRSFLSTKTPGNVGNLRGSVRILNRRGKQAKGSKARKKRR